MVLTAVWCTITRLLCNDAVLFEFVESLAKRAGIDALDGTFQFAKALRFGMKVTEDKGGPFLANNISGCGYAANA